MVDCPVDRMGSRVYYLAPGGVPGFMGMTADIDEGAAVMLGGSRCRCLGLELVPFGVVELDLVRIGGAAIDSAVVGLLLGGRMAVGRVDVAVVGVPVLLSAGAVGAGEAMGRCVVYAVTRWVARRDTTSVGPEALSRRLLNQGGGVEPLRSPDSPGRLPVPGLVLRSADYFRTRRESAIGPAGDSFSCSMVSRIWPAIPGTSRRSSCRKSSTEP